MIGKAVTWLVGDIKEKHIDYVLVASVSLFIFWQGYLTSDEAYKYVNPYVLFWTKGLVGGVAAMATGLKALRMNTKNESKTNENTQ